MMARQRAQPVKLTGFCDIVSQAAMKKGKTATKPITTKTATTAKAKTMETTTTTTTTTSVMASSKTTKTSDKWEEFREKKLAEMKQHKINVERRMQTSCNIDGQMYWSQRADKLKRYPKHEALHPAWYTENIYSNHSIDLETDDFGGGGAGVAVGDQYGPNEYDRELFHRKKTHIDTGYGYPKISRSCCFGSGYDERPKPVLMPKSSSFTGTSSRGMSNVRTMYSTVEEESYLEVRRQNNTRNNMNRSGLRKFYCWENDRHQNIERDDLYRTNSHHHLDDDCYMKNSEVYQIERDRNYYKKPNIDGVHDVQATTNANYIRNIWHNRNRSASLYKVQNVNEINGNYLEDYNMPYDMAQKRQQPPQPPHHQQHQQHHHDLDAHHPFEEEYLIIHQNKPNINLYSARNSFDDPISVSRRQSYHSNEMYTSDMDPYSERYLNRDKNCLDMYRDQSRHSIRSKSMLEVKPPNRYDDTSSDSTIDDLYDFNFDFANQYELDYRNNNNATTKSILAKENSMCNASTSLTFKEKNINVDNYSEYRKCTMDSIDDTDNELNDVDFISQSDEDEDINFNSLTSPRHSPRHERGPSRYQTSQDNEYMLSNRGARERYYDNCMSGTEYYPTICNNSNNNNPNLISSNGNSTINKGHHQINNMDLDDNKIINNNTIAVDAVDVDGNIVNMNSQESNGAISLINNIFSIYKPRKYSPVSCHRPTSAAIANSQKVTKNMNIPSTARPLGAPDSDCLTSLKRPLTFGPSCFTSQKRNWFMPPTGSVDQAHFKIIPEKTGLKISPLYRFGYEDDSKLRLKCTARPLLFPL
ncbi:uncharacterized protein LOC116349700 [Contarinia nasturtii]|uniref:uncharacterized protein LOC116349700 n=1 Tax=Contarinia nasturtii TaxID=265458 RepID=UPI0012D40402|nr:uncharacterized protein LOC116349700 [Contarinia nasturtii]